MWIYVDTVRNTHKSDAVVYILWFYFFLSIMNIYLSSGCYAKYLKLDVSTPNFDFSNGWHIQDQVPADWISGEGPLLASWWLHSCCILGLWKEIISLLFIKTTSPIHSVDHLWTNCIAKVFPPESNTLESRFHYWNLGDCEPQAKDSAHRTPQIYVTFMCRNTSILFQQSQTLHLSCQLRCLEVQSLIEISSKLVMGET